MDERELEQRLEGYNFYHTIPVTDRLSTAGTHGADPNMVTALGTDLTGKRVLDVGCRDGLYSFLAEKLGASEVIGIDNDLSRGAVDVLIPHFGSAVRMHEMNLYDLTPGQFGKFDVLIFADVLYHLRYPFRAFQVLRDVANPGATLIVKTGLFMGSEDLAILYCPIGLDSPYEPTSCTFFNRKGLVDSLTSLGWRTTSLTLSRVRKNRSTQPVEIRDSVTVCEFTGQLGNELVDRYWHATHHDGSSQFAGNGKAARASGVMSWKSEG
ncbi:MAG TPA: methyltransferase domain-containing protein [Thermoanaerobaculia bacterium]|jgi:SAM-dependent methyltransferase|nr:methyltransferase domain-containing protein [Thermoanaerobaculia bacterium]